MKKLKPLLIKIILICTSFFIFTISYAEPTYMIDNLKVNAQIQKDGSVKVSEMVQYDAYAINGILYNIDYKGYGDIKDLKVFYEKNGKFYEAIQNNTRIKGSYELFSEDELSKIKLYFPMNEEKKWFLFTYTLSKGVTVYNDIAQFNRKIVGRGWGSDIYNIEVKITLPEETDIQNIHAFGHGPLTGNVDILNGREILYSLQDYYAGEFVETNILFPKELISEINPNLIKNENGYEKIIQMEKKLADKANMYRELAKKKFLIGNIFFYLWGAWLIFVLIFAQIKNGRKYKVTNEYGEYFRELPDNFSPAVAGAITTKGVRPMQLLATVMDLVRKDIFELIEDRENNKTYLKLISYDSKLLKRYETFVIKWYIEELGDGEKVAMEDIEEYISSRKHALEFGKKYEKWKEMVEKDLNNVGFNKEKPNKLPIIFGMFNLFVSIPLTVVSITFFGNGKFVIYSFLSFISIPFISSRRRYTLKAEQLRSKWLAFKKFLIDYSNLEEAKLASIHIWEHYFVYAIALGVAENVAKGYKKIFSGKEIENSSLYHRREPLMYMYGMSRGFHSIEKTTMSAVSRSMNAVARSRSSSSSGRGGGFSGGSSGGGGSRGGGGAF